MSGATHTTSLMKARRITIFSACAMAAVLGLFLWLVFWYDDILPENPPASPYENVFSVICVFGLWPFVFAAGLLGKDPPSVLWLPIWIITGLFWGCVIEWFRAVIVRLRAKTPSGSGRRFWWLALAQATICVLACGLWFYWRASNILAHPANPENYGTFGSNWRFQWIAFLLSRMVPILSGLILLLLAERFFGLLVASRSRPRVEAPTA